MKISGIEIDNFTRAYLVCALWSSTNDKGDPLDDSYDIDDIGEQALIAAASDCKAFQEANASDLSAYYTHRKIRPWSLDCTPEDYAGHDFWLTRNGHGAGFWDRGLGVIGDRLSTAAHAYGESVAYVGDDGKIYLS